MSNPWRQPAEDSDSLYPGLVVCDNRVSGSITVGRTRLPLCAFIGEVIRSGWDDAEKSYSITEYGMTPESLAEFLYNLLECRGEFGRLLLTLADGGAMSSAWAAVRFPDGTVKACIYNGTSDLLVPRLYDTTAEAWEARRSGAEAWPEPEGDPEPVSIYTDYGGGFWWEGRATRNVVTFGVEPYGSEDFGGREISPALETHDEVPAWVPEWRARQE